MSKSKKYQMYPIPDDDLPINKNEHTIDITNLFNPGYGYNTDAITNPLLQAFMGDGGSTKKERKQGKKFSNVDLMKMQWDYSQAVEERRYNEYLYNQYESPAAQMRQYQQAGLNPALMYQGATGGQVASSHNAPTSAGIGGGTQETNGFDTFSRIIEMITGAIGMKNQIDATRSQIKVNDTAAAKNVADAAKSSADAKRTEKETSRYDEVTDANIAEVRARIQNTNIDTELKQSQIEVNKVHKDLTISQNDTEKAKKLLVEAQTKLANANAEQINKILPYLQEYKRAEINLMNSQGQEALARAYKEHEETGILALNQLKEMKMLNEGVWDEMVKQMKNQTKQGYVDLYLGTLMNLVGVFL